MLSSHRSHPTPGRQPSSHPSARALPRHLDAHSRGPIHVRGAVGRKSRAKAAHRAERAQVMIQASLIPADTSWLPATAGHRPQATGHGLAGRSSTGASAADGMREVGAYRTAASLSEAATRASRGDRGRDPLSPGRGTQLDRCGSRHRPQSARRPPALPARHGGEARSQKRQRRFFGLGPAGAAV